MACGTALTADVPKVSLLGGRVPGACGICGMCVYCLVSMESVILTLGCRQILAQNRWLRPRAVEGNPDPQLPPWSRTEGEKGLLYTCQQEEGAITALYAQSAALFAAAVGDDSQTLAGMHGRWRCRPSRVLRALLKLLLLRKLD